MIWSEAEHPLGGTVRRAWVGPTEVKTMRCLRTSSWFAFGTFALFCAAQYLDNLDGHVSRWSGDFGRAVATPILSAIAAVFLALPFHLRVRRGDARVRSLVFAIPLGLGLSCPILGVIVLDAAYRWYPHLIGESGLMILAVVVWLGLPFGRGEIAVRLARLQGLSRGLSKPAPMMPNSPSVVPRDVHSRSSRDDRVLI